MSFDRQSGYQPVRLRASDDRPVPAAACLSCPFGDEVDSETVIAERLFGSVESVEYTPELGFHIARFAGHVTNEADRAQSTSGGLATWLMGEFLDVGIIDAAICVAPTESPDILFNYTVVTRSADLAQTRKARYYPVETSSVITHVLENEGRYGIIGLPCTVKSIRLAALQDDRIKERIVRTVAIFCGHMKTPQYADYLSRTVGVDPLRIRSIDFRQKTANPPAQNYEFAAQDESGRSGSVHMQSIPGGNWGQTLFMQDACNWCDDVVGETADVSLGDAWISTLR